VLDPFSIRIKLSIGRRIAVQALLLSLFVNRSSSSKLKKCIKPNFTSTFPKLYISGTPFMLGKLFLFRCCHPSGGAWKSPIWKPSMSVPIDLPMSRPPRANTEEFDKEPEVFDKNGSKDI
jgi:hypothetical protein